MGFIYGKNSDNDRKRGKQSLPTGRQARAKRKM